MKTKEIKVKGKLYEAAEIDGGQLGALSALIMEGDIDIEEKPVEVENPHENWKVFRVTWETERIGRLVLEAMGGYMPVVTLWGPLRSMYVMMEHTEHEEEPLEDEPERYCVGEAFTYYGKEDVWISDPCYLEHGKFDETSMARIKLVPGVWHCRQIKRGKRGRTYKVVMYADSADVDKLEEEEKKAELISGYLGVDTGMIGVISYDWVRKWTEEDTERVGDAVLRKGNSFDLTTGLYVTETEHGDGDVKVAGWKMRSGRYKALFIYLP